jgi:hypothetical protein
VICHRQQLRLRELLGERLLGLGLDARLRKSSGASQHERLLAPQMDLEALQSVPVDGVQAAIEELERAVVLTSRRRGAGGVGPAAVREVGPACLRDRLAGGDRWLVGLDEPTAAHQRERASVAGVVGAQILAPGCLGAELRQQPLRLLDTAGNRLGPCPCGQRFAALLSRGLIAEVEQLDRCPGDRRVPVAHASRSSRSCPHRAASHGIAEAGRPTHRGRRPKMLLWNPDRR